MKIAYLGDKFSHSYACATSLEGTLIGYNSISKAILSTANGETDKCVVPIENSVEGAVNETMDTILNETLYINQEITIPIHNSLIGFKNSCKSDIKTIYSHHQAISQCRKYLETNFANIEVVAVSSTSEGLKSVDNINKAAIARLGHDEQIVLDENIEDYKNNVTRFVVLSKNTTFIGDKVSIVFDAANKSGALLKVLETFKDLNINMTKIESRPHKSGLGHYIFYVDFICNLDKQGLVDILQKIGQKCGFLKFLGKY